MGDLHWSLLVAGVVETGLFLDSAWSSWGFFYSSHSSAHVTLPYNVKIVRDVNSEEASQFQLKYMLVCRIDIPLDDPLAHLNLPSCLPAEFRLLPHHDTCNTSIYSHPEFKQERRIFLWVLFFCFSFCLRLAEISFATRDYESASSVLVNVGRSILCPLRYCSEQELRLLYLKPTYLPRT